MRKCAKCAKHEEDMIAVNSWGLPLIEGLGKFLQCVQACPDTPMTTRIECRWADDVMPVVYLWATISDKEPAARCAELRSQLDSARKALRWALAELGYPGDYNTPIGLVDACNDAMEEKT